ncbi:MAG: hypothetical protein JJ920_12155 [Roseitalea sp.]|jgi:hypothetical protein|nr:hypothetical protein [Roseitalea sp.]MBO6720509.1 hypothetical protein [Roseitalea sp.]MBO6743656.1 hypothetical protein [Roseitalea sp.]
MTADRFKKRALRVLAALNGRAPVPVTKGGAAACILHLGETRTIRCPADQLEAMVDQGWLHLSRCPSSGRTLAAVSADGVTWHKRMASGDGFAGQHREVTSANIDGQPDLTRNLAESPLARLARPGGAQRDAWLNHGQVAAGERLRSDFEFGQLSPSISASWNPARTVRDSAGAHGDPQNLSDRVLDARVRFNRALDAVGPELSGLLVDVCCFLKGLEQVELERKWPRRSAKVVLRTALAALDRHYNPPPPQTRHDIRHWGEKDYRPTL